ncbi:hypothetical protein jhhlp_000040 [Lomentospora prolificans]|uniref:EH domain-containing protein n=1 Tax=Lomentospora prolificans TaxID=41688 RepID=A0A2N3NLH6_9PEZI|nr:hypothetical protein jhhlp_000040 [Lomentospora prolificans]
MPSHPRTSPLGTPSPSATHSGGAVGAAPALQGALLAFQKGSPPKRPVPGAKPPPPQPKPKPRVTGKPNAPSGDWERQIIERCFARVGYKVGMCFEGADKSCFDGPSAKIKRWIVVDRTGGEPRPKHVVHRRKLSCQQIAFSGAKGCWGSCQGRLADKGCWCEEAQDPVRKHVGGKIRWCANTKTKAKDGSRGYRVDGGQASSEDLSCEYREVFTVSPSAPACPACGQYAASAYATKASRKQTILSTPEDQMPEEILDDGALGLTRRDTANTTSSHDTFVSASSVQSPSPPASRSPSKIAPRLRPRTPTSASPTRKPAPPPRRKPGGTESPLPTAALSNAIVAGSLASARLTPSNTGDTDRILSHRPQPSPRLLQTLRHPEGHHSHHHHHAGEDDSEAEREKRYKRSRLRPKKHAHHEGARKRWRDYITEAQRRRYEAVWASNRGSLMDLHVDAHGNRIIESEEEGKEFVVNVVVREIWRRSRLPSDELEEVWALVDREGKGVLGRREFVVGTWLVDQRLKGRKIPARVGDSVWDSASGVIMKRK